MSRDADGHTAVNELDELRGKNWGSLRQLHEVEATPQTAQREVWSTSLAAPAPSTASYQRPLPATTQVLARLTAGHLPSPRAQLLRLLPVHEQ